MFEIKTAYEMNSELIDMGSCRYIDDVACRYITAANAEIKRLQQQSAMFDDILWEPVTLEALENCEKGIYQFRSGWGDVSIILKTKVKCGWIRYDGFPMRDVNITTSYSEFRKLPIALYTPAPEKLKRYEVIRDSREHPECAIWDNKNNYHIGEMSENSAKFICDKLNRLEELEKNHNAAN